MFLDEQFVERLVRVGCDGYGYGGQLEPFDLSLLDGARDATAYATDSTADATDGVADATDSAADVADATADAMDAAADADAADATDDATADSAAAQCPVGRADARRRGQR